MSTDSLCLSIFEIPLLLDLICSHFQTAKEIQPCLQVSRLWRSLFSSQIERIVRFADLDTAQTWAVIDRAHRIRHLEIDLEDAGLFLQDDQENHQAPPYCRNLQTLSCVDFGYFPEEEGIDRRWFDYFQTLPISKHAIDSKTNALSLLERNPKLESLRVEHGRSFQYGIRHFTPAVLSSLSSHRYLSQLILRLTDIHVQASFLKDLFLHLPTQLEDLEIRVAVRRIHPTDRRIPLQEKRALIKDLELIALKRFLFHQVDRSYGSSIVIVPFLGKCPHLEDLSLSLDQEDGSDLVTVLLETQPPLEKLDLTGFCPHHMKTLVETFPRLISFSTGRERGCSEYSLGCGGAHTSWIRHGSGWKLDSIDEDSTGLIPALLSLSASTLTRILIFPTLGVRTAASLTSRILQECLNLKELAVVPESYQSFPLDELLVSKPWSCTSLESLELAVYPSVPRNEEYQWQDLHSTDQTRIWMDQVHRFYQRINKTFPRLKPLCLYWDLSPCGPCMEDLSLETAQELLNRDKNGKLRPTRETLTKKDIQEFLGLPWETGESWSLQRIQEQEMEKPWIPLAGVGRGVGVEQSEAYFPGFIHTGRTRQSSQWCYCSHACQRHYEDYSYKYGDFSEKVSEGPWYRDRKKLFKTNQNLHPRHSLKGRRKPFR